jgi:hypothetical protein
MFSNLYNILRHSNGKNENKKKNHHVFVMGIAQALTLWTSQQQKTYEKDCFLDELVVYLGFLKMQNKIKIMMKMDFEVN